MGDKFKQEKLKNFTVIRNEIIDDTDLSFKALGLAVIMLRLPPDWKFSIAGLSTITKKSSSSIKTTLKELEDKGYLKREQSMKNGKFSHMVYTITDKLKKRISSLSVDTLSKDTLSRNDALLNTYIPNTNKPNTKSSSLRSEDIYSAEFERLWELYPRKQGKKDALKKYLKVREDGTTYEEVEQGIRAYAEYIVANHKEDYTKMGSTFFSQEAWGDDWSYREEQDNGKRNNFGAGGKGKGKTDRGIGDSEGEVFRFPDA